MGAEETDTAKGLALWVPMTSRALYVTSFFLPAVMNDPHHTFPGYEMFLWSLLGPLFCSVVLLVGRQPMGFLLLVTLCPWLANVAYWIAVRRLWHGYGREVAGLVALAVILGLSPLACHIGFSSFRVRRGGPPGLFPFREGYWLWLGSMTLLAFGCRRRGGERLSRAASLRLAQYRDD
jgi:hypothetical protein